MPVKLRWCWPHGICALAAAAAVGSSLAWVAEREDDLPAVRQTVVRLRSDSVHRACQFVSRPDRALLAASCDFESGDRRRRSMAAVRRLLNAPGRPIDPLDAAQALLGAGDPATAVARLEALSGQGTMVGPVLAARGAARIELALELDDPYQLVLALDDLERARRSGAAEDADYNRALALSLLGLRGPARQAWIAVRDAEEDVGWRSEAEIWIGILSQETEAERWSRGAAQRLESWLREGTGDAAEALSTALRHPQHARQLAEESGFVAWAEATLAGRPEGAAEIAKRLVALADTLAESSGDALLLSSARPFESCVALTCAALAEGHLSYTVAREYHELQEYELGDEQFDRAFDSLSRGGSPFAFWPAFYRAVIVSHQPDFERAVGELRVLLDEVEESSIVARGYLGWMLGLVAMRRAEYGQAIEELERARDLFRATGERENESAMESQIAWCWDAVGQPERAWRHHARALALLGSAVKSRRLENVFSAAGNGLRAQRRFASSLLFQEQAVAQAIRGENELGLALALGYQAESLAGLDDESAALAVVEQGLAQAREIPDPGLRDDVRTGLLVAWASIGQSRPVEALDSVESAIHFAEHHSLLHHLPKAYAIAANLRRRLGDPAGEMAALAAAVAAIERQRARLTSEHDRLTFAALTREIMEQGARSLADQGRWEDAFFFTDGLRARELRDALAAAGVERRELDPATLDAHEGVLSYLVLSDRVLVWLVRRGRLDGLSVAVGRDELAHLVAELVAAIRSDDLPSLHRTRARLSGVLIARLHREIAALDRLIVIPDGPLERLPFAALVPSSGGFLFERASISTLPAASLHARQGRSIARRAPRRWLFVAGAEHSLAAFPTLERLPIDSARINQLTAGLLGEAELLTGLSATPDAFRRLAPSADVLVFLGHAVAPTALSARAGLVLAPGEADDGLLDPGSLDLGRPPRPQLAILAGCSTGRGPHTAADGPMSLSRGLLRSGVPRVVATLWEIEHAAASEMIFLLLAGVVDGSGDPLRAAQLRAFQAGLPPSLWLPFQSMIGADAR